MRAILAVTLAATFISPALAQRPTPSRPAPAATTPAEPQSTTASFGDWTLRCQRPEGQPQTCEIGQTLLSSGRPVAQFAIGRPAAGEALRLTFVVMPNLSLEAVPRLMPPSGTDPLVELGWRRCFAGGCLADVEVTAPLIAQLRAQTEPGRLIFADSARRETTLPFSPNGLASALDALGQN
nr:invasion associated locus B family protein [uncultured Roseococcus sp.]